MCKMKLEVLLSTLRGDPKKIVRNAKINSDIIIINQCDEEKYEEFKYNGNAVRVWYTKERGIGRSRNAALEHSAADIVLFADDDEVFNPNYMEDIVAVFERNQRMDFAVCSIKNTSERNKVPDGHPVKVKRLHRWNSFRYGAPRFAVRKSFLDHNNIKFDDRFGASKYGHGEDSIFIQDCLSCGARIYAVPEEIAVCSEKESSWFEGYDKKYYYDTGAIFARSFGRAAAVVLIPFLICKRVGMTNMRAALKGLKELNEARRRCICL